MATNNNILHHKDKGGISRMQITGKQTCIKPTIQYIMKQKR